MVWFEKILIKRLTGINSSSILFLVSCEDSWYFADLAQLVEQLIRNEQVVGSNPIISSICILTPVLAGVFC